MPDTIADVWLWCPVPLPSFSNVRITLEVSPALKVRMSIRLAGPHLDITKSHDQAAMRLARVKTPALAHRERPTRSLSSAPSTVALLDARDVPSPRTSFVAMLSDPCHNPGRSLERGIQRTAV